MATGLLLAYAITVLPSPPMLEALLLTTIYSVPVNVIP